MKKKSSEIVAVIPLREGSKGLPNKNVLPLNSKPLYLHTVQQALRITKKVIISTNIKQIIEADNNFGCVIDERPEFLSEDDTQMSSVLSHVIKKYNLCEELVLLLQATSPLRSDDDILSVINLYETNLYNIVLTVTKQMCTVLKYGTLENQSYIAINDSRFLFQNRQYLPPVYGHNGAAYLFAASQFLIHEDFPKQKIGAVVMPKERSIDIDDYDSFISVQNYLAVKN